MSAHIDRQLLTRGFADVIVLLSEPIQTDVAAAGKPAPGEIAPDGSAAAMAEGLAKHFTAPERAQTSERNGAGPARRPRSMAAEMGDALPVPRVRLFPRLGVMLGTVDGEGLAGLSTDPRVKGVVGAPTTQLLKPHRVAGARMARTITWGIEDLGVPALWKQGLTGRGIRIGHLDTGVDGAHPAFRGAIDEFAEFDQCGREVSPAPPAHDSDGHGTHTAGTIAGRAVRGVRIGVAPGARLVSGIVIEGGDLVARVLAGINWAIGHGIRILNLSLGLAGLSEDFVPLTRILRSRNILPVFAVGDHGANTSIAPGNNPKALSVGSYDQSGAVWLYSSSQRFRRKQDRVVPNLVGPGVGVLSARPGGGFRFMSGTSMATPHIAGLAALLMEAKPGKTVDQVEAAIFRSCQLKPGTTADRAGLGVPNASRALALL